MRFTMTRGAVLAVYALLVIVPVTVVVFGSFKTTPELFDSPFGLPSSFSFENYDVVLNEENLAQAFANSVVVTATSVFLTLLLGSLAAYATARIPGWKGWLIFGFLVLGMSVPAQANMIPQYVLFNQLGLLDSRIGLVIINIVVGLPVAVFILGGFMKTLPRETYEAGSVDGAGPFRTYWSIVMPMSMPSLAATAIFLFVIQWNDLLYPLLFISTDSKKTIPLALLDFQGQFLTDYPLLFTGVVIASLPMVVAYVLLQRYFVAGITAGAVKG
ncbi:carbohydrate ABC transporter permease [Actinobacteria bacterium YIM 96077]|uniref:Carbohydrate ABC transporter permease n=1 Tax=Phytoactinopolyspora halophila TaxID=1981511 RepID=A0A329QGB2_9ACTN|nr:carbohydrate ABC transporter permease [Phytoactinopolyspora halophila]AYY13595.1 carbohydrate ABC transporter permease [Actinobacteria bacterium YIM 96077]RAW10739.1 carbohydrate ABC transporter permease [Phytoactinopolyspora halophila]